MSTMEEQGLIRTRQAHVIGGGRRKRKVVHITEVGRNNLHSSIDDLPEPRSRTSSKLKGQLPELTHLHGRMSELQLIEEALERNVPIHLRGMPELANQHSLVAFFNIWSKRTLRFTGFNWTHIAMFKKR